MLQLPCGLCEKGKICSHSRPGQALGSGEWCQEFVNCCSCYNCITGLQYCHKTSCCSSTAIYLYIYMYDELTNTVAHIHLFFPLHQSQVLQLRVVLELTLLIRMLARLQPDTKAASGTNPSTQQLGMHSWLQAHYEISAQPCWSCTHLLFMAVKHGLLC